MDFQSETFQAFPFFQTSDTALQQAYSYGDPRGGSYPDLPSPGRLDDDAEEHDPYVEQPETELVELPGSDGELPGSDVEFTLPDADFESQRRQAGRQHVQPDLDGGEFPSSGPDDTPSNTPSRAPASPPRRGRGRGRPRGRARGGRAARGRGKERSSLTGRRRKRAASVDDDALVRPRKRREAAVPELSDEFKRLNSIVTNAWMNHDYDAALQYGLEAIQLNPNYFPLHGTIAEILTKKGRPQDAIGALFAGVHSSREAENWWYVVDRLHELGGDTAATRSKLLYCYSTLVSLNSKDYQARLGRLGCYREKGLHRRALNECRFLLRIEPNDVNVLDQLAELSATLDDHAALLDHFEAFLETCLTNDLEATNLTWNHLVSYADALIQTGHAKDGIKKLITASRWLLGRGDETYWDAFDDDREWDPSPEPRRVEVEEFTLGQFDESTYGLGLPIELRVKLGVLRVLDGHGIENAMAHLEYLLPEGDISHIQEYADLFKEAGDVLRETGHHSEALLFYEPMKKNMVELNSKFFFDIAICYQALGRKEDVRSAIKFIKDGERTVDFQIGLAKLYQSQGRLDLMWRLCLELRKMGEVKLLREVGLPAYKPDYIASRNEEEISIPRFKRQPVRGMRYKPKRRYIYNQDTLEKRHHEQLRNSVVSAIYDDLKALGEAENPDGSISQEWLRLGDQLCDEFLNEKQLFPRDRTRPVSGMAEGRFVRFTENIEAVRDENEFEFERPTKYRSIDFDHWVTFLMLYSINNAKAGKGDECWKVLKAIESSNAIFPEPKRLQLLRLTSLYCAVVLDDENKVCDEVRLFFKGSSWATDAFRLKSAVIRALRCEVDIFSCGPEQKFYLRQIKAMDYALLDEENRDKFHFKDNNRVRYAAETQKGPAVPELSEHDPALLALYGHMLYVGGSPGTSLNYYYRAYVLKPDDPILNLCMGLAYVGMAFKRQAVNRQFHVQQGMMFFNKYCDVRRKGRIPIQLQEMEFNMGMLWNSIGLLHLAVPAYQKCIDLSPRLKKKRGKARKKKKSAEAAEEDFAPEAALALRTILAINGDMESAMALTRKWLVL